ncbi:dihydrolipoyllysine-residue succinyltransferase component of 2-oxoglutarate dehydrogenase complex [Kroppenstedtia guangzhouensis]|uniref:Dihydrolipoyllysine-residue succinyltransferase component of 2-oxoglutarate dehydrogenase complex n=1 Tax=Kroppenstedtia guangzhouensis TaxID=1274356 RepID=A0ABQ1G3W8_9BACL|nr:2-oxoglutarate dehydrogenase complex dihydrolipoyllysine-residue succinyltransferase [Kroppenstedtia guangzhouensis]GGA37025.1 dihydrolipoyllysine-residue succinyltransferase component of 2-oxoglutarate dehydrogenase complex [Kroppenstedtia guangzhouensis]
MHEVKVPELAESITEGTISDWLVSEGDQVNEGDVLLELETDKVNVEIHAEHSGMLQNIRKKAGDTVEVGEVIAQIGEGGAKAPQAPQAPAPQPEQKEAAPLKQETPAAESVEEAADGDGDITASPAARKLAREKGIDLRRVRPSDPMGRVTVDDVKAHTEQPPAKAAPVEKKQPAAPTTPAPGEDLSKPVERVPMTRRRQTIAKRLVEAQQTAAMLTTFNEVDMSAVIEIRKRRKEAFKEQHDVNLGFMSFFTKAVVGALKAYPVLNAEIDGTDVLYKKFYDIGIAVATDNGLVVPVVRDADRRSFAEIEREIANLAQKARNNKLALSDLQGGTFTITNGGVFGSLLSTPILNAPQVGILGMHTIQKRPVTVDGDRLEHRPMMYIALSYDHRLVDGKEAVGFLVTIKKLLEDPELLMLEG